MSRIIGTVHASPFFSRPVLTMLSKSCSPTNPSSGLKMPSAMFSISFRSSLLTCTVKMPSSKFFLLSDTTNLFTSLPPWGNEIEPPPTPDTLHHTHTASASSSFLRGQSGGRTLFAQRFPTTIFLPVGLHLALLPLCMVRSQCWESPYHEVCCTGRYFCECSPIPCQTSSLQVD